MSREIKSLLLDEVKSYRPSRLRSVETRVTHCGGNQEFEKKTSNGIILSSHEPANRREWFAPDYRPDLQVAVILPGLLLGAQDVAQDLGRLRKLGVSHILNLATGVANCFPADFTYKRLNIRDHPDMNIRRHFEECFKFIDQGRRQGWVYVHCNAGISRAATICISYLMSRQRMHLQDAINKVKDARPIISPNTGFLKQLREYENEIFGLV
ncbi:dual specificity protein phosphatase 19 [Trichonephila inaurata madagascariensis]|uniref:Dual specificity protein phosphatase 19 n=1 Tax=Trichonephila inaurata madagascariensis TaxID=2747483 RepID=A0A8X6WRG2_9ARAC|nr:dual specificity protein phosphatase 19 [Trichonephila inaurata madagascariensis]